MPHNYFRLIQSDPFWATSAASTPSIMLGRVMRIFASIQVPGALPGVRSRPGGESGRIEFIGEKNVNPWTKSST